MKSFTVGSSYPVAGYSFVVVPYLAWRTFVLCSQRVSWKYQAAGEEAAWQRLIFSTFEPQLRRALVHCPTKSCLLFGKDGRAPGILPALRFFSLVRLDLLFVKDSPQSKTRLRSLAVGMLVAIEFLTHTNACAIIWLLSSRKPERNI